MKVGVFSAQIVMAGLILASCRTTEPTPAVNQLSEENAAAGKLNLCAAVRGNGHYILSHFGALGRITENFGVLDAMAGGSSATVTMFIYESILTNPLVKNATGEVRKQRVALLLKSALGYFDAVKESPEAHSMRLLYDVLSRAQQQGLFELTVSDYAGTARALNEILNRTDLVHLVNPNVLRILVNADGLKPLQWKRKINEVQLAARSILSFKADNQKIFFREGIINFKQFATTIGRIADFYAGSSLVDMDRLSIFLNECGAASQGKEWTELSDIKASRGSCGDAFRTIVEDYRDALKRGESSSTPRVDQPIGEHLPSVVSTALIADQAALRQFEEAKKRYDAGREPDFKVDFDAVKFGYFLPASLEQKILDQKIATTSKDAKDRKFYPLGGGRTWRQALETSPAEPGLSPGVMLPSGELSIGGWSDLAPVQILEYAGCDKIVYLTRRGEESNFLVSMKDDGRPGRRLGVAEQLNIKDIQRSAIYDLDNSASAFSKALAKAEGVWCTDWNRFTDTQIKEMYQEAFNSELVSRVTWFLQRHNRARIAQSPIRGCSSVP